ncbi:hypothetical protein LZ32DRAFT_678216 [Colletotrichum eremochloae]|nr:hypothetical protein LZ32DRAFT_678216 [Colletotrichum eremochloae]
MRVLGLALTACVAFVDAITITSDISVDTSPSGLSNNVSSIASVTSATRVKSRRRCGVAITTSTSPTEFPTRSSNSQTPQNLARPEIAPNIIDTGNADTPENLGPLEMLTSSSPSQLSSPTTMTSNGIITSSRTILTPTSTTSTLPDIIRAQQFRSGPALSVTTTAKDVMTTSNSVVTSIPSSTTTISTVSTANLLPDSIRAQEIRSDPTSSITIPATESTTNSDDVMTSSTTILAPTSTTTTLPDDIRVQEIRSGPTSTTAATTNLPDSIRAQEIRSGPTSTTASMSATASTTNLPESIRPQAIRPGYTSNVTTATTGTPTYMEFKLSVVPERSSTIAP